MSTFWLQLFANTCIVLRATASWQLGGNAVLVVGYLTIAQDLLQAYLVYVLRIEPVPNVFLTKRDDAALMACGGNLRRRLVSDGRKGIQIPICVAGPM